MDAWAKQACGMARSATAIALAAMMTAGACGAARATDTTAEPVPGTAPPSRAPVEKAHHRLVGVDIPARNYNPRDRIKVLDPWDRPMVLSFNTFLNPQLSGPVVMTVESDDGGHIPTGSQFLANCRTINGQTYVVWMRLTLPNGKVGWVAPKPRPGAAQR